MAEPRCPQCAKPVAADFAPFCSRRCQQVDLGRWLAGAYVIPGRPDENAAQTEGDEAAPDPGENGQ